MFTAALALAEWGPQHPDQTTASQSKSINSDKLRLTDSRPMGQKGVRGQRAWGLGNRESQSGDFSCAAARKLVVLTGRRDKR